MAVDIVARARNATHYKDTQTGKTWADLTGHDQHYLSGGVWTPVVEGWQADSSVTGFSQKSDRHRHKVLAGGNANRRWYPRRDYPEYVEAARPMYWDGSRWRNLSLGTMTVSGNTVTFTSTTLIVALTVLWSGVRITLTLRTTAAPLRYRWPLTFQGLAYDVATGNLTAGTEIVGTITVPTAHDANGAAVSVASAYTSPNLDWTITPGTAVYPITVDPDFSIYDDPSLGPQNYTPQGGSTVYATAHANWALNGNNADATQGVGQYKDGAWYYIMRLALGFDTSSITTANTVTQANLKLTPTIDGSTTDFDVQLGFIGYNFTQAQMYAAMHDMATDVVWRNTSGISANTQYASPNLTTGSIVRDGMTRIGCRSSRDDAETAPSGNEYLFIAGYAHATAGYRPVLTVEYSAPAAAGRSFCVIVG